MGIKVCTVVCLTIVYSPHLEVCLTWVALWGSGLLKTFHFTVINTTISTLHSAQPQNSFSGDSKGEERFGWHPDGVIFSHTWFRQWTDISASHEHRVLVAESGSRLTDEREQGQRERLETLPNKAAIWEEACPGRELSTGSELPITGAMELMTLIQLGLIFILYRFSSLVSAVSVPDMCPGSGSLFWEPGNPSGCPADPCLGCYTSLSPKLTWSRRNHSYRP